MVFGAGDETMLRFLANAIRTISAAALLVLAIALAPTVEKAFAASRPTFNQATLNRPLAQQSCAAFEDWFLDPTCSKVHVKKLARKKHHLAQNVSR
jgi:hypothetical protein